MSVHLNQLLDDLKARVARMSTLVYQIVETAVEALLHADAKLAQRPSGRTTGSTPRKCSSRKAALICWPCISPPPAICAW
jgi:hypothetical protein